MADTLYKPLDLAQTASAAAVPAGITRIQAKPDGKLYVRTETTEIEVGPPSVVTQLNVNGGTAATTFQNYLLRLDFGANGASINPMGTP